MNTLQMNKKQQQNATQRWIQNNNTKKFELLTFSFTSLFSLQLYEKLHNMSTKWHKTKYISYNIKLKLFLQN